MSAHYVKAVLFDLDGTLVDTAPDFIRIIGKMASQNGWQTPPADAIREQVSAGAGAMIHLLLTHNDQPADSTQVEQYRQQFLDDYEADICIDSQVFPELDGYLDELAKRGTPWGIVTNKPRYLAELLLDKLGLSEQCDVLICPDDVRNTKPDPEPMYLAMEKLGLPRGIAGSVIYVGDHKRDIDAGNRAGMITVLAGFGYIPPEDQDELESWQADYIAKTPSELVKLLDSKEFDYL